MLSGATDRLRQAVEIAGRLDDEVDFLARQLRPAVLDDLGLAAALPKYVEQWSAQFCIAAEFSGRIGSRVMPADVELTFYRVAQEALHNITKHARARHVGVLLEQHAGGVLLIVGDNGIGFDPGGVAHGVGLGLVGMQERATLVDAMLEIESTRGVGTTIFLRWPAHTRSGA